MVARLLVHARQVRGADAPGQGGGGKRGRQAKLQVSRDISHSRPLTLFLSLVYGRRPHLFFFYRLNSRPGLARVALQIFRNVSSILCRCLLSLYQTQFTHVFCLSVLFRALANEGTGSCLAVLGSSARPAWRQHLTSWLVYPSVSPARALH